MVARPIDPAPTATLVDPASQHMGTPAEWKRPSTPCALVRTLLCARTLLALGLDRELVDGRALSQALAQGGFQIGRSAMFAQQVAERLVGKLLKALHAIVRQQVQRMPGLVVELHPFARHQRATVRS